MELLKVVSQIIFLSFFLIFLKIKIPPPHVPWFDITQVNYLKKKIIEAIHLYYSAYAKPWVIKWQSILQFMPLRKLKSHQNLLEHFSLSPGLNTWDFLS